MQPVDGCGVLVVGDGETRSAILIADLPRAFVTANAWLGSLASP
ncbi:MAG: hypothetical protein QGH45_10925 [Myxococcota bacterium]|nr:hypothetical protein [Myxococcota bacterium]